MGNPFVGQWSRVVASGPESKYALGTEYREHLDTSSRTQPTKPSNGSSSVITTAFDPRTKKRGTR